MCFKRTDDAGAHGAATDENGDTALFLAAQAGFPDVVKALVASGKVDVKGTNGDGETALVTAAWYGNVDACAGLIEQGASVVLYWPPSVARARGLLATVVMTTEGLRWVRRRLGRVRHQRCGQVCTVRRVLAFVPGRGVTAA